MASTPNSLNPTGPTPKMMPEGSRKVCVLNGSRQLDQVVKGEWMTIKVLPENGLPKGIYQLAEATKPDTGKDGKESAYTGQVLHVDSKAVYQLSGKGSGSQGRPDRCRSHLHGRLCEREGHRPARPSCQSDATTAAQRLERRRHFPLTMKVSATTDRQHQGKQGPHGPFSLAAKKAL